MQLWITFITHTHILSISTRKSTVSQPKILATFLSRIFGVSLFFCPNIITTYAWGILEWGTRLPFPHQTYDEKQNWSSVRNYHLWTEILQMIYLFFWNTLPFLTEKLNHEWILEIFVFLSLVVYYLWENAFRKNSRLFEENLKLSCCIQNY